MGSVLLCVAAVHSLTRSFPSTATSHPVRPSRQRHTHPLLSEGGETDWEEAMRALRARSDAGAGDTGAGDAGAGDAGVGDAGVGDLGSSEPGPSPFRFESSPIEEPTAGFRFDRPGAERPDEQEQLVRLATVYGGRLLTAITLSSLVFYIYVGLSVCCHLRTSIQSSFMLICTSLQLVILTCAMAVAGRVVSQMALTASRSRLRTSVSRWNAKQICDDQLARRRLPHGGCMLRR